MNVFYNREGIGDTVIITIKVVKEVDFERKGDIARIFDRKTKETVGYNIFNASKYIALDEIGSVTMNEEKLAKINAILTKNGFTEELSADFSPKFVVGYVKKKEKHSNADKLSICTVDVGEDSDLQIVCGAPNVDKGQRVVVAKVGAVMPSGMMIKDAKLRGVASSGMICSAKELELPNAPEEKGILVLADEKYEVGEAFIE